MSSHRTIRLFFAGALASAAALTSPSRAYAADVDGDGVTDEADALPCDPRAQSVAYAPGKDKHGLLVFEDLWPSKGDIDFNDVGVTYNYIFMLDGTGKVSSFQASFNLVSAGASISNDVLLHLPVPVDGASKVKINGSDGVIQDVALAQGEHEMVIPIFHDTLATMGGGTLINTQADQNSRPGVAMSLYVQFTAPVSLDLTTAPFDLFISRTNEAGHQIHQLQYPGTDTMDTSLFGTADDGSTPGRSFVDTDGLPFALVVPPTFQWPLERVAISNAYPDITSWAASAGGSNQDWYATDVQTDQIWTGGANGTPAPVPVVLGPTDPTEDIGCAPWKGTVQFGLAPTTWTFGSATDPSGNVLVAGYLYPSSSSNEGAFVSKFSSSKVHVWTQQLNATGYAEANGVATDPQGNVYVSGQVSGSFGSEPMLGTGDSFVAKLDPGGNLVWVKHIGNAGTYYYAWGVALAPDGSIYTTGYTNDGVGAYSYGTGPFVAKLDSDGNVLWNVKPNVGGASYGYGWGAATDASGNVLFSGYVADSNTRAFVAQMDPSGNLTWSHQDSSYYSWNLYQGLAASKDGSVYATGYRESQVSCNNYNYYCYYDYYGNYYCYSYYYCTYVTDVPLWKFDGSGTPVWTASVATNSAEGFATTVGPDDNPVIAGYSWASVGGQSYLGGGDYFVTKFDSSGNQLWTREGITSSADYTFSICADSSSSVFVAGDTTGDTTGMGVNPSGQWQSFISKYDASGNLQ